MDSSAARATLASSAEDIAAHAAALRSFGADYSVEQYKEMVEAVRERGIGERYATRMLGADREAEVLKLVEDQEQAIVMAAERRLLSRGVDPAKASYQEYAEALAAVSA